MIAGGCKHALKSGTVKKYFMPLVSVRSDTPIISMTKMIHNRYSARLKMRLVVGSYHQY